MSGGDCGWPDDVGLDGERRPGCGLDGKGPVGTGCEGDEKGERCGERRAVDVTDGRGGSAFASEIAFDVEGPSETDSSPSAPSLSLPRSISSALLSLPRQLFLAICRNHSKGSSPTRRRTRRESLSGIPSLCVDFEVRLPSSIFCRIISKKGFKATSTSHSDTMDDFH